MDKVTCRVSPSLRNVKFSFVTDSSREYILFISLFWLSALTSFKCQQGSLLPLACLLTHPGWAGQNRDLQGHSLTLRDVPGPSRRCREVSRQASQVVQSTRASFPTEPVLKTPYSRNRGVLPRKNVWLVGRRELCLMRESSSSVAGLAQCPALCS